MQTEAFVVKELEYPDRMNSSVGLALYLQRFDDGNVDPHTKVLVVNTGKGV